MVSSTERSVFVVFFEKLQLAYITQTRILNLVKHLRWSKAFCQKLHFRSSISFWEPFYKILGVLWERHKTILDMNLWLYWTWATSWKLKKPFVYASTTQKIKFSIKSFFNKCDQIRSFLQIWWYLLKKLLIQNIIFMECSFWYIKRLN